MHGRERLRRSVSLTLGFHNVATCHASSVTWMFSCGQTVNVMWVSYMRLSLVYLSCYEGYDRQTQDVPLDSVDIPVLSSKYLTD